MAFILELRTSNAYMILGYELSRELYTLLLNPF